MGNTNLIDVGQAETLCQKAKEPKELIIIDGMGHPPKLPEEFYQKIDDWLVTLLSKKAGN